MSKIESGHKHSAAPLATTYHPSVKKFTEQLAASVVSKKKKKQLEREPRRMWVGGGRWLLVWQKYMGPILNGVRYRQRYWAVGGGELRSGCVRVGEDGGFTAIRSYNTGMTMGGCGCRPCTIRVVCIQYIIYITCVSIYNIIQTLSGEFNQLVLLLPPIRQPDKRHRTLHGLSNSFIRDELENISLVVPISRNR